MQGVHLMDALLNGASLRRADLYWATAFTASFQNADLTDAKLNGAALNDCDFTNALLTGADLGRDNLDGSTSVHGANFTGADLSRVIWDGAGYDSATVFPAGFDPKRRGLVLRTA